MIDDTTRLDLMEQRIREAREQATGDPYAATHYVVVLPHGKTLREVLDHGLAAYDRGSPPPSYAFRRRVH